jgi:hypothetical protein
LTGDIERSISGVRNKISSLFSTLSNLDFSLEKNDNNDNKDLNDSIFSQKSVENLISKQFKPSEPSSLSSPGSNVNLPPPPPPPPPALVPPLSRSSPSSDFIHSSTSSLPMTASFPPEQIDGDMLNPAIHPFPLVAATPPPPPPPPPAYFTSISQLVPSISSFYDVDVSRHIAPPPPPTPAVFCT